MKKIILLISLFPFMWSCGSAEKRAESAETDDKVLLKQEEVHGKEIKGLTLSSPLDQKMVKEGQAISDLKCSSCHRLTEERIVGPGWKDVTKRRKPIWIVNMITNVDMMLAEDEEAQKMLELCLVRMPNQNVTEKEARSVIEFMRQNDGEK